jgi:xanthine dehydrogenase small subunit
MESFLSGRAPPPPSLSGPRGLAFMLNGRRVEVRDVSPTTTLLQWLRDRAALTGTKEGCAEGDCGACTVAIVDRSSSAGPTFRAVNSCLVLLPMVDGKEIVTVEGVGGERAEHPVQRSLVERLGSQCGYCTPGVVMSMFEACYRADLTERWQIDDQMCGNLCRCTGYRPIREATQAIAGLRPPDRFEATLRLVPFETASLEYSANGQSYFAPTTLAELWSILDLHPDARIIAGGTDLSLLVTKRFEELPLLVSLENLAELSRMEWTDDGFRIGSTVHLSDLESTAKVPWPSIERMLRFFGSRQIKNRGTVGGNVCNASPIGDLPPILMALDAQVELISKKGTRNLPLDRFFLGYRKTALAPKEILASVFVPKLPSGDVRVTSYKVSKRQELDISAVAAGLYVELVQGRATKARFAFGGMAATPKRAALAEAAVMGAPWNEATVEAAARMLERDFTPIDDHRGSAWYRRTVARNLLFGFFHETAKDPSPRHQHRPTGSIAP